MPNLTQLGDDLFIGSSMYSVVIHKDDKGQVWVSHHTDKTRQYRTNWDTQKVAEAIDGTKTLQERITAARNDGVQTGKAQAKYNFNRLPWWKRVLKVE